MNHNVIEEFINDYCPDIDSFSELFKEIYNISIKNFGRKMIQKLCQFIAFVYIKVMHWRNTRISALFCKLKVTENKYFFLFSHIIYLALAFSLSLKELDFLFGKQKISVSVAPI